MKLELTWEELTVLLDGNAKERAAAAKAVRGRNPHLDQEPGCVACRVHARDAEERCGKARLALYLVRVALEAEGWQGADELMPGALKQLMKLARAGRPVDPDRPTDLGLLESVSLYCRRTHNQWCHICDRLECGDNTSPEAKALRDLDKACTKQLGAEHAP